jgi:hypothetical protein
MDSQKHAVGTARSSRSILAGQAAASEVPALLARQCWQQQHALIGLAASMMLHVLAASTIVRSPASPTECIQTRTTCTQHSSSSLPVDGCVQGQIMAFSLHSFQFKMGHVQALHMRLTSHTV